MTLPDRIHQAIEAETVSIGLLEGLPYDQAEAKAIAKIAAKERLKPADVINQIGQPRTPTANSATSEQARRDGAWVRQQLTRDFPTELLEGLADMTDADLLRFCEESGIK
jgi:hypothetical protein